MLMSRHGGNLNQNMVIPFNKYTQKIVYKLSVVSFSLINAGLHYTTFNPILMQYCSIHYYDTQSQLTSRAAIPYPSPLMVHG